MPSVSGEVAVTETVKLHTTRWLWLSDTPYRSVHKITTADGTELSARSTMAVFEPGDLDEAEISLTGELSQRLTSFFDRNLIVRGRRFYNCHRFALWMSGVDIAEGANCREMAEKVIEEGSPRERSLALGQMGVIGHKMGGWPSGIHSVVGLGEDVPRCLQVMGAGGDLAIAPYDNTQWLPDNGIPLPGFGMYVSEIAT